MYFLDQDYINDNNVKIVFVDNMDSDNKFQQFEKAYKMYQDQNLVFIVSYNDQNQIKALEKSSLI